MRKKPVIGIILDLNVNDPRKYLYAKLPWYALRQNYATSVEKFGGVPVMLPYNEDIDSSLWIIDGLIIAGCDEDIHPRFYGQDVIYNSLKTKDERAVYEIEFTRKALARNMPVLGICNGLQIINTIFGGTLIQHIPDSRKSDINHEQPEPKHIPSHKVLLKEGTLARALSTSPEIMVNSTHHQAIDKLGLGLIASGFAPDGIIEVIESVAYKFLFGVQWHSEHLNNELDQNLFKKLIEVSV